LKLIDKILDAVFPNVCGFCEEIDKYSLCEKCKSQLPNKLFYGISELKNTYFNKHIYLFSYEGKTRERILSYKFGDRSYMYKTFARIILNNEKVCKILIGYDIITEVPIHKKRKAERGYDQSKLIAKEVAKGLEEIKYLQLLKKNVNNSRQSVLQREERLVNVKNAYWVLNKEIIKDKKIIIFDDIYTTGSTVNECARILRENGAREVLALTLAK